MGKKMIVLQRHNDNLEKIEKCLRGVDEKLIDGALFTLNPDDVIREIKDGAEVFVIAGQMFDHHLSGTELAKMVKQANPNSVFYIFSTIPEGNSYVDGVFVKNFQMCPQVMEILMDGFCKKR